jgi:hypothetical protein
LLARSRARKTKSDGARQWRVNVTSLPNPKQSPDQGPDLIVTIETKGYDRPRTGFNSIAGELRGYAAQQGMWEGYMRNMNDAYSEKYGAVFVGSEVDIHGRTPEYLGYVHNPWGPGWQYIPPKPYDADWPSGWEILLKQAK